MRIWRCLGAHQFSPSTTIDERCHLTQGTVAVVISVRFVGPVRRRGARRWTAHLPIGDAARRSDRVGDGHRFVLPAISFITDLLRQATPSPVITAVGSRPFGAAPRCQAPISRPLRAVLDPLIVIKKHRSSLSGNTVQPHVGVGGITAPFLHAPRYGGYRATLNGWAPLERGGTHAPTNGRTCGCSHLRSDRRVRAQQATPSRRRPPDR